LENYKLLNKYKVKLSLFFALFFLASFYLIQAIFIWTQYITHNIKLEEVLNNRLSWVINILNNKETYYSQIESEDKTLEKLILKTLENSIVYKNWIKSTSFAEISPNITWKIWFFNEWNYKILIKNISIKTDDYKIVLLIPNEYLFINFLKDINYFSLFLLPFFILFYFIWYFFVWKNFKVIEQSINSLEDFTSNINHEIKTPLSEIISTLSLAKKINNYEEANEISLNSAFKLNKIIDSITWIANLWNISYRKERVDLILELNLVIKEFKQIIDEKNIILEKKFVNKNYRVKINKEHFYMCVRNILSNAIKYSHIWWKIEICFNSWLFEIKDYWIWIDKINIKNIFNRYFRENYIQEEWFWLWLALVKKVVDINNWKIEIESEKDLFTKITIKFI
jgi:hypothetical protein